MAKYSPTYRAASLRWSTCSTNEYTERMNGMKSQSPETSTDQAIPYISGRFLILGVVFVALACAALVWWFQYSATHLSAEFWGPEASILIRDAPQVEFIELQPAAREDAAKIHCNQSLSLTRLTRSSDVRTFPTRTGFCICDLRSYGMRAFSGRHATRIQLLIGAGACSFLTDDPRHLPPREPSIFHPISTR